MIQKALSVPAVALLSTPAVAQVFEDPGAHPAGWRQVTFPSGTLTLKGRTYYPALAAGEDAAADPSMGPYPLAVLIHGQSFEPKDYDTFSLHLASWGYVIVSIGPLAGPLHAPPSAAAKAVDMLAWMEQESADPTSVYAGLVGGDAPYAAFGHSLGGNALEHLVALEPKLGATVALEPYLDASATLIANLAAYGGSTLSIGGELDLVVPPAEHAKPFFDATGATGRNAYFEILGAGHYGVLDALVPGASNPLPYEEQNRLHRKAVTAFLEAEIRGDENAYLALFGEGAAGEPVVIESSCELPPLWLDESAASPGDLVLGLGGRPTEPAWIAYSPQPASIVSHHGTIGLDPALLTLVYQGDLGALGAAEAQLLLPPLASGRTLYAQGLVLHPEQALLSRTAVYAVP
ncbi:MAG: hypothetical protein AAF682_30080 [Planctomycetota bacterium]